MPGADTPALLAWGSAIPPPDGRGTAEGLPLAYRVIVGVAVGDDADTLLQFHQNAERVGGVIDFGVEQHAFGSISSLTFIVKPSL